MVNPKLFVKIMLEKEVDNGQREIQTGHGAYRRFRLVGEMVIKVYLV